MKTVLQGIIKFQVKKINGVERLFFINKYLICIIYLENDIIELVSSKYHSIAITK